MSRTPENISRYIPRVARAGAVGIFAIGMGLIDRVAPNSSISLNTPIAEACSGPDCDDTRTPAKDNCEREVLVSIWNGIRRKTDGVVIASVTGRTTLVRIPGYAEFTVRTGSTNNSAEPVDESARKFHRQGSFEDRLLHYYAVPVGRSLSAEVARHRLNENGSFREGEASNPKPEIAESTAVCGCDIYSEEGRRILKVLSQDSQLGDQPGDYTNSEGDLVFQTPDKLFQSVHEFGR